MAAIPQPLNNPQTRAELSVRHSGAEGSKISGRVEQASQGLQAVSRPSLFSGISPGDYSRIAAAGRIKEFERGEMLYWDDDPIKQVFLLVSGLVKTTQVGMSGAEVILGLSGPGDVLGAISLVSSGRHSRSAKAFRLCRVLAWDASTFKGLVQSYPALYQNMTRIMGAYLLELEERFREVATERVGPRVARQLVRLGEQIGQLVEGEVDLGLSREDLAQMTGTTLFTVSRLLCAWEAQGWVRCGRETVTIRKVESLRAISK